MLKQGLTYPFIFLIMLLKSSKVFAFDPITLAMTAQSAQSMMSQVDEAADIGFALTEIMSDVGIETEAEEQSLQMAVDRVYKINSEAKELKWSSDDLNRSLSEDLAKGKSLARRIKSLRNSIQASKQIATIMGYRPKSAEKAFRIQQIKLDSMMLEELQSIRRAQYLAYLENKEAKLQREVFIQEILEKAKPQRALYSDLPKFGNTQKRNRL